ncbi:hypothetical protein RCC89_06235 [Cytophagaceae bacterium ABcell3]|nr:hypothetical protein RCC89_06235 [Cytophagaceae bacterium ABcell3]
MLEYQKMILQKVSFDQHLFEKELRKSTRDLLKEELIELKKWCYENFGQQFHHVLKKCFRNM